jgi:penicillin-binding protein 2
VREGLLEATHSSIGTSSGVFGSFPVSVSGKTGTAEHTANGRTEDDAWWCGYAPSDKPTIALCAMIENGGFGGTAAAPAALKVLQRYFGVKSTTITPHVSD